MKDTNYLNGLFSYLTGWFNKRLEVTKERTAHLQQLHNSDRYSGIKRIAGRASGRRSGWHLEQGLLKRVKAKGFGKFVRDFGPLENKTFEEQLLKGEKLMTSNASFKGDRRKLMQATLAVRKACNFPTEKFMPVSVEKAAYEQLNHRSSSGFPRFVRKGHILDELIDQTKRILKNTFFEPFLWPQTRGFRVQIRESCGQLARKVRLMYPYPGCLILLEDVFIMPFVNHFINTNTFYVIGRNGEQVGSLLKEKLHNSNSICSLDVSSYDQNIVNEAIICAFWIIRSQLSLTKNESLAFDSMVDYFLSSIMVSRVKGSPVYSFVKTHGIPSGSGFTNMVGSIAHAIIFEYLEPGIIDKCLICGDDNIFDSTSVDLNKLFNGYKNIFNLPVDPVKTDTYTNSSRVKFLGFEYVNYIRTISPLLAINQMLWHTDFLVDLPQFDRELARSASILLNGKNGKYYFSKLFPEVINSLNMGVDVRFVYLHGTAPPTTSSSLGLTKPSSLNYSLSEHLERGYLIR